MILPASYTYNSFKPHNGVHRVRMFLTVPAEGGEMSASDKCRARPPADCHTRPLEPSASSAREDVLGVL